MLIISKSTKGRKKSESYEIYIDRMLVNPVASICKMMDLTDNMNMLGLALVKDSELDRTIRYAKRHGRGVIPFRALSFFNQSSNKIFVADTLKQTMCGSKNCKRSIHKKNIRSNIRSRW